jgi:hypothetical protein
MLSINNATFLGISGNRQLLELNELNIFAKGLFDGGVHTI